MYEPGVKKRNGMEWNETVLKVFFQKRIETKRKIFEEMRNEKKRNEIQKNETETKKLG
jgi:mevalonate pyrophosphate decarboxylase